MTDYISREELKRRFCGHCNDYHDGRCFDPCFDLNLIDNTPAADVVPVMHGKWIAHKNGRWIYAECGACGSVHDVKSNYCPSCGAKMDSSVESSETRTNQVDGGAE